MKSKVIGHRMGEFEGIIKESTYKKPADTGTKPIPEWKRRREFFNDDVYIDNLGKENGN